MRRTLIPVVTAAVLTAPAGAAAHVTLQPSEVKAGGFTVLNVRVPNERDNAGTVEVAVQFPDGFATASYQPVAGWDVSVEREQAPSPIDLHGEQVDEQIDTITFTGDGRRGLIEPGQFQDFPISVAVPAADAGTELTFKAIQTYENGEVVRWIGGPDSDEPAPIVTLLASDEDHGAAAPAEAETPATAAAAASADEDSDTLNHVAVGLGALGLLVGVLALARSRRLRTA